MINPFVYKSRTSISAFGFISRRFNLTQTKDLTEKRNITPKPPNLLLYCPGEANSFIHLKGLIENCLLPNHYTVYPITSKQFATDPWMENVEALIMYASAATVHQAHVKVYIDEYLKLGGKVLSFNVNVFDNVSVKQIEKISDATQTFINIVLPNLDRTYQVPCKSWSRRIIHEDPASHPLAFVQADGDRFAVAVRVENKNPGICTNIFSTLTFHDGGNGESRRDYERLLSYLLHCVGLKSRWNSLEDSDSSKVERVQTSTAFLFVTSQTLQEKFLHRIKKKVSCTKTITAQGLTFFPSFLHLNSELLQTEELVTQTPVLYTDADDDYCLQTSNCSFDWNTYRCHLTAKQLGHIVIYSDVVKSTMGVFDGVCGLLGSDLGGIAIAKQQTKGRGRGSNEWLSPVGCAMFTVLLHIPVKSHLGHKLPFLQHMTSVAVVHAIRTIQGLEEVELTVKWPNDIYFRSSVKLGGVIVQSTMIQDTCVASIGCGVNIANEKPTLCVNNILQGEYSLNHVLKCEEVIARTVSILEKIVVEFQQNGPESFLKLYYKYWIHSLTEVEVQVKDCFVLCTIMGVDDCGFLLARRQDDGEILSLQPDGNSFDITKNLIIAK